MVSKDNSNAVKMDALNAALSACTDQDVVRTIDTAIVMAYYDSQIEKRDRFLSHFIVVRDDDE